MRRSLNFLVEKDRLVSEKLELAVQVGVDGTTFQGIYKVKGKMLEPTSPDFGVPVAGEPTAKGCHSQAKLSESVARNTSLPVVFLALTTKVWRVS